MFGVRDRSMSTDSSSGDLSAAAAATSDAKDMKDTPSMSNSGAGTSSSTAEKAAEIGPKRRRLTVLTWNVDTEQTTLPARLPFLLSELRAADADVMCLQETSTAFLRALTGEQWVREQYAAADVTGRSFVRGTSYGDVILTRLPLLGARTVALPTVMGRQMVIADIQVDEDLVYQVRSCRVHLALIEFLPFDRWRRCTSNPCPTPLSCARNSSKCARRACGDSCSSQPLLSMCRSSSLRCARRST